MGSIYVMQELSATIRAVAENYVETISGLQALSDVPKGVAFEDHSQMDEVCIPLQGTIYLVRRNWLAFYDICSIFQGSIMVQGTQLIESPPIKRSLHLTYVKLMGWTLI